MNSKAYSATIKLTPDEVKNLIIDALGLPASTKITFNVTQAGGDRPFESSYPSFSGAHVEAQHTIARP